MEPQEFEVNRRSGKSLRGLILILLFCLAGLAISAELLRIHLAVGHNPSQGFGCQVDKVVDCGVPALSEEALFLGVPVPVWAILTYLGVAGLALASLLSTRTPLRDAADYVLLISLWSVGYSAYLAYVSAFKLEAYCAWCTGLYFVNLGLLLASLMGASPLSGWPGRRRPELRWLVSDPVKLSFAVFMVVVAATAVAVLHARSERPVKLRMATGKEIDLAGDPMYGYLRAPVTIIEFSDYECPACRKMHETIRALLDKYDQEIRLFHKNYPLDSKCNPEMSWRMHPFACEAAWAAECAYNKGKYKAYAEKLWRAKDLSRSALITMAEEVGMDPKAFEQCMDSEQVKREVLRDIEAGQEMDVFATPTFIVNSYAFTGYQDLEWCSRLIEKFLQGRPIPSAGQPVK